MAVRQLEQHSSEPGIKIPLPTPRARAAKSSCSARNLLILLSVVSEGLIEVLRHV